MLEGLRILGRAALEWRRQHATSNEEALLHALVKVDEADRYNGLIHLHLVHEDGQWRLAAPQIQEVDTEVLYQALWLGHASRNLAQDRATVSSLEYLISQALPALGGFLASGLEDEHIRYDIAGAIEAAYLELPVRKSSEQRYRWVLNLPALGWARWEWIPKGRRKELEALAQSAEADTPTADLFLAYAATYGPKRTVGLFADMLLTGLQERLGLPKGGRYLYTLHLNGKWLAREPAYHRYLYRHYLDTLFENARPGTCYLCGQDKDQVTDNTTRFWFKFYITDKPGFASGFLKENFYRNYRLCPECYQVLLAGETFMRTRLRSWLGTQVYIIPVFHLPHVQPRGGDLNAWADYIADRWQASLTLEGWKAFQQRLDAYRRFEDRKASFLLDFLFVEGDERSTKLQHYIRDVPPSRLDELDEARNATRQFAERHLAPMNTWDLGLRTLFYLFPIGRRGQGRQAFFQFLEALLTQRPMKFRHLVPLFLETASIHRFQKYGAYVHSASQDPDLMLRVLMVQTQLLRRSLQQLNMLIPSGGVSMQEAKYSDEVRRLVPADVWEYMDALALTLPERALFLLGMLVGEVAMAQQRTGSTPILNKIHFQGMDAGKIRRLSNEMLDQLRIYRALNSRTKDLFAATRVLMDQARALLSPAENTYWVLSGYAFRHMQRFGQARNNESENATTTSQTE